MQEANLHWRYLDGEIIMPWYTKPALEWLKQQDTSTWKVFEYGCGYSTIWWRLNCQEVNSIDDNNIWAKAIGADHTEDKLFYINYVGVLGYRDHARTTPQGYYDCIIIDGEYRDSCTEFCLPYLKPGGYLIIDNYEQPSVGYDYTKTNELLKGWEKQVFKQHNHSDWQTAIFTKPL